MRIKGWCKIGKQPKGKQWITAEYVSTTEPQMSVLVYKDDKQQRKEKWAVFVGATNGDIRTTDEWLWTTSKRKALALAMALRNR